MLPRYKLFLLLSLAGFLMAWTSITRHPDLGHLYDSLAQTKDLYRNPVIVMPGLLGPRLVQQTSGRIVWGAFGLGQVDPNTPEGARMVGLPMRKGSSLSALRDDTVSEGALDRFIHNALGVPVELNANYHILRVLGVGGYRDQGLADVIDYGDQHFTCFQFDYEWRRDIVESAVQLYRFIRVKQAYIKRPVAKRFAVKIEHVKFDMVAHSMGGLVARYYIRYGTQELPLDGSLPELNWKGLEISNVW